MPSINQQKLNILCLIQNEHTDLTVKEPTLIEGGRLSGGWGGGCERKSQRWRNCCETVEWYTKTFVTQSYGNFISQGKEGGKILRNFSTVYWIGMFFMSWLVLGDNPLLNSYLS